MPDQGDLYLGVRVASKAEAKRVLRGLGLSAKKAKQVVDGEIAYVIPFRNLELSVTPHADDEDFACEDDDDWSEVVLGAPLTGRYTSSGDEYLLGLASEPFRVDPDFLQTLLEETRVIWPDAEIWLLTTHY